MVDQKFSFPFFQIFETILKNAHFMMFEILSYHRKVPIGFATESYHPNEDIGRQHPLLLDPTIPFSKN